MEKAPKMDANNTFFISLQLPVKKFYILDAHFKLMLYVNVVK